MPQGVTAVSFVELFVILAIVGGGFALFIRTAWSDRSTSWSFGRFFLGGRNIGADLTEHTNWGLTFAWSNGVWFFAVLAYSFGPAAILLQIPWCISVAVVAAMLRSIMSAVGEGTIHGFLGKTYGDKARVVACIATSIGYVFNCGFEMYWSARMFSQSVGYPALILPAAFIMAGVCGAYCMIGGYLANCKTDKEQTIAGMTSLALLCVLAATSVHRTQLTLAAYGLGAIAVTYVLTAFVVRRAKVASGERLLSALAVISIPLVFVFFVVVRRVDLQASAPMLGSTMPPIAMLAGIIVFQLFFNAVDMANWQTVAANGGAPPHMHRQLRWSFVRSAIYMLWFPAAAGVVIGCIARVVSGLKDDAIFPAVFAMVAPDASALVRGALLGIIFLGLISTSLSAADTYIMAAAHTLSWDLILNRWFREIRSTDEPVKRAELENDYVDRVRRSVLPLALFMTLAFAVCYWLWPKSVFAFQFIMYGSALALFAPIVYGLILNRNARAAPELTRQVAPWAIAAGVVAGLGPYAIVYATSGQDISGLAPIFSLSCSGLIFLIAVGIAELRRRNGSYEKSIQST